MRLAMASCDTGYEDELFQYPVPPSLHCCICTNVIKDPVMCENEHIFCKACIITHLMNSQTCPTCMRTLTVQTLQQATRGIRNLLSELKIRCGFFDRGCERFVELGDLERHAAECGFAPVVCSNEECQREVNKQDLLQHVCERRQVKCHSCFDLKRQMDSVKLDLAAMNEKLARNEKSFKRIEEIVKRNENVQAMVDNATAEVKLVQEQLVQQVESNSRLEADNAEMKKTLNEMVKQLERVTQQTSRKVRAEHIKAGIAKADVAEREPKIVIAGGASVRTLNSVEVFSLSNQTWKVLQPMREFRQEAFSVVYDNHILIAGGKGKNGVSKSIEKLPLNAVHTYTSLPWENFLAELPGPLVGHSILVFNGRFIVIGGYDFGASAFSNSITEISLAPPYTSKLLTAMPQSRCYHAVAIFKDKILILGGRNPKPVNDVVLYDVGKNQCQKLAPLPHPLYEMASVKCSDDSVMIMGGTDERGESLNQVFTYNVKTQKIKTLPEMKYKRRGCVAAIVRDTVIVMGGRGEGKSLTSVESFTFDRNTWEELPEMHEARYLATAVVC